MNVISFGSGPQSIKPRKYLFIDGNYFQRTIKSQASRISRDDTPSIDYIRLSDGFDRVIYYDALPVKKKNQKQEDYDKEFSDKQEFLNSLRLLPKYHVRDGITRMRPRAKDGIEQKGVDTWMAIEILQYAFGKIIDVAEIITGDLDLYPLFEALIQTHTTGILHYEKAHTSQELIMSADAAHPITTIELLNWSNPDYKRKYTPGTGSLVNKEVSPQNDTQMTSCGKCTVRFDQEQGVWQANFESIGNVFTAKNRLLLIDQLNKFIGNQSISDTAFKE